MMLINWAEVHSIEKNTESFVVASKETGLEVNGYKITWSCLEISMQNEVALHD